MSKTREIVYATQGISECDKPRVKAMAFDKRCQHFTIFFLYNSSYRVWGFVYCKTI